MVRRVFVPLLLIYLHLGICHHVFFFKRKNGYTDSALMHSVVSGSSIMAITSLLNKSTSVDKYTKIFVSIKYLIFNECKELGR